MCETTIVVADGLPVVLIGLRTLLESNSDFRIVAESSDGLEVIQLCSRFRPDVLLIDQSIPHLNGLDTARHLREIGLLTKIIILVSVNSDGYITEALGSGVTCILSKSLCTVELPLAIRDALAGEYYVSQNLLERPLASYIDNFGANSPVAYDALTVREREVLQLAAEGHTNIQIASRMFISVRTAETHRSNLMHKLGLKNHTALVLFAIRRGILALDD